MSRGPLLGASAQSLEPLCAGPLHTQWKPCLGDGLRLDPKISGELSANFLLFTLARTVSKKAARLKTERPPLSQKFPEKFSKTFSNLSYNCYIIVQCPALGCIIERWRHGLVKKDRKRGDLRYERPTSSRTTWGRVLRARAWDGRARTEHPRGQSADPRPQRRKRYARRDAK